MKRRPEVIRYTVISAEVVGCLDGSLVEIRADLDDGRQVVLAQGKPPAQFVLSMRRPTLRKRRR